MATKKKAPAIKAAKKAVPKKKVDIPDEAKKVYEQEEEEQFIELLPEENIDEPSIADILKRNKAN